MMSWRVFEYNSGRQARCALKWLVAMAAAAGVAVTQTTRARAEDTFGYRFEDYQEDGGRISIQTDSWLLNTQIKPWLSLNVHAVHDAISGASPTGSPAPSKIKFVPPGLGGPTGPFSTSVPMETLTDDRWAGSFDPTLTLGRHRLTPEFSYSQEHDYISFGSALNYSVDLNEKNTTLNLGWSHNLDTVLPKGFLDKKAAKHSDEVLVGVNQLLGPKTVLTANLIFAGDRGYLNDQYKGALFASDPQLDATQPALEPEKRPRYRDRYTALVALTQEVRPLHASVEGSYRFYVDSYGVLAHTLDLAWYQKLGKYVVISPLFRYYRQSAADFYAEQFGDFNHPPAYYSADYRLSNLETFTVGLGINCRIQSWLTLDAGFKRYIMRGLDGVTSPTAYPSANVFTMGARLWF